MAARYNVRDMVWLDIKNIFTKYLYWKLENCRADPYPVKWVISAQAVKLNLLENICVYPIFYVNLLEPAATDSDPSHILSLPPLIKVDREIK